MQEQIISPFTLDSREVPNLFPNTRSSLVLRAKEGDEEARADMVKSYWQPLYHFALRSFRANHFRAQDLVQDFFVNKFWHCLSSSNQEKGKLRSFLLTAFTNEYLDLWRKEGAEKRGGRNGLQPLDDDEASDSAALETDLATLTFDRDWALNLWERAVEAVYQLMNHRGASERFWVLSELGVIARDPSKLRELDYQALSIRLGESETTVRKIVSRCRDDVRRLVREEVLKTLSNPLEVDEEFAYMLRLLFEGRTALA